MTVASTVALGKITLTTKKREIPRQANAAEIPGSSSLPPTSTEPSTKIHPLEAQCVAQEQWATLVEHRAHNAAATAPQSRQLGHAVLLTFSRHKEELEVALLKSGPALTALSMGMDIQPAWAKGGKVFVDDVVPENFDEELGPMNVVVHEADEDALFAALQKLPWNIKKLKPGTGRSFVPAELSMFEISSDEEESKDTPHDSVDTIEVRIKYGFIHVGQRVGSKSQGARSVHTV